MCRVVGIGLDDVYTAPSPTCAWSWKHRFAADSLHAAFKPTHANAIHVKVKQINLDTIITISDYNPKNQKIIITVIHVSLRGDASPGAIENKLEFVSLERSNEHSTLLVNI